MLRKNDVNNKKIVFDEELLYEKNDARDDFVQFVVFRLGAEWYAVGITKVKEVIKIEKITFLPSSPDYILGIVNVRGNILSVMDLKKIFDLEPEEITAKSRLVIIESGTLETGIFADEVCKVMEVPVDKIEPALSTILPEKAEYIEGGCKIDDKLIGILKVEKILEKKQEEI